MAVKSGRSLAILLAVVACRDALAARIKQAEISQHMLSTKAGSEEATEWLWDWLTGKKPQEVPETAPAQAQKMKAAVTDSKAKTPISAAADSQTETPTTADAVADLKPAALAGYVSDASMICGGPQMWNLLTASSSVQGVQNIKWAKMEALHDDHVRHQEKATKELEVEIEGLTGLVAQKEGEKRVKYTAKEQHAQLVEAALGPDSFGGLEVAKDSGCGRVGGGPVRAPRRAYRKSLPLFEAAAGELFAGKQFRLDGDGFLETCNELLPAVSERSACVQMCQQYKDMAQKASNEAVGETAGDLDALIRQREEKLAALAKARASIADCDKAWDGISLLRTHIEGLKGGMQERFELLRQAEMDLDDARWDLSDLDEELKEEEQMLNIAVEALEEAGQEKAKADAQLQDLLDKEKALRLRIAGLLGPLDQGRQQLEAAKRGDKAVVDLKAVVSATMVKMELFSRAAVVEPLKNIGFDAETDLDDPALFPPAPRSTHAGVLVEGSIGKMQEYCASTAIPKFEAVKEQVDLTPLCGLGETEKVMNGLSEAVLVRRRAIKKDLLWVKSWLNPYRGSKKMTKERAAELVAKGEPKGFQEIISLYHGTKFFRYLKDWRYNGPFLKLLAQLRKLTQKLDAAVLQLEAELNELKAELVEITAAREKAAAALEQMADQLGLAEESKAAVEKTVLGLREQAAKMAIDIERLEEAVRQAKRAYEDASQRLVASHHEGTSALPRSKESLAELEAQGREVDQLVSLIQQSLDDAERSYQESQAQLSKLKL